MADAEAFAAILGEVIADRRRGLPQPLSQEQLGYRSGITPVYVSELERGLKSPTVRTLLAIATALGTTPSELLREAETWAGERGVKLGDEE